MLTAFTHVANSADRTLCDLEIPPVKGWPKPERGSRVGIIVGDYCIAAYVAGSNDVNPPCMACARIVARMEAESDSSEPLTIRQVIGAIFKRKQPNQQTQ